MTAAAARAAVRAIERWLDRHAVDVSTGTSPPPMSRKREGSAGARHDAQISADWLDDVENVPLAPTSLRKREQRRQTREENEP